ncbi:hypothetical protein [Sphingomonas sp. ACRSK]|uniref:hypothetical protein n=1 Tax=Sphingomonas sp. ACRSK TaxID=2918213 RepID=UPI001EF4449E|nr:hypothetical protein [Sphingomonas sp. ACRSK]MCG7348867.1 hypothetical protein [Sphingomonas sp. ACRSK]
MTMHTMTNEGFGGHISGEGLGGVSAREGWGGDITAAPRKLRRLLHRDRFFETLDDG